MVDQLGAKLDPEKDEVAIDGKQVNKSPIPKVYWMLHKPDMCLTSHKSEEGKETIFTLPSLKSIPFKVNAVGRLDYRTEGLLLLSNDGEFIHRLTHPRFKVPRYYYALVGQKLSHDQLKTIKAGVELADGKTGPIDIQFAQGTNLGKSTGSWYYLKVTEGRNRLVRRIFEHFDTKVIRLIRAGFGDLRLPESLLPGDYRQLDSGQIKKLKKAVGLISKE